MRVRVSALRTALVTGASSGIGRAFAERLAADGHDLILVARDRNRLEVLAEHLAAAHGVRVEVLAADLADPSSRADVEKRLADVGNPVDLLVNNAGDSIAGGIAEADPERLRANLALNVGAVLALTRSALPGMLARRRGAVVNVSSVNGFVALPWPATVYGAGKLYVTMLSESLSTSLAGTGVHVMALCPGLTRTQFAERNQVDDSHRRARARSWSPETVVDIAVTDLSRGRVLSVPGLRFKVTAALGSLLPYRPLKAFVTLIRQPPDRNTLAPGRRALITGSSWGVGPVLAERLAAAGLDLVLVARDDARLRATADRLSAAYGNEVEIIVADLADPVARTTVERRLADEDRAVDLLVNNAGSALSRHFVDTDPAELQKHLQVNVASVLQLTCAVLPGMLARGRGDVINVSSVTGFLPGHGSIGGASRAYVTSLSRGLALSLPGTGVHVMALCPKFTRTGSGKPPGRARTVDKALADLAVRKAVSVPGIVHTVALGVVRVIPRRLSRTLSARSALRRR